VHMNHQKMVSIASKLWMNQVLLLVFGTECIFSAEL
jgi:hypothetical protein